LDTPFWGRGWPVIDPQPSIEIDHGQPRWRTESNMTHPRSSANISGEGGMWIHQEGLFAARQTTRDDTGYRREEEWGRRMLTTWAVSMVWAVVAKLAERETALAAAKRRIGELDAAMATRRASIRWCAAVHRRTSASVTAWTEMPGGSAAPDNAATSAPVTSPTGMPAGASAAPDNAAAAGTTASSPAPIFGTSAETKRGRKYDKITTVAKETEPAPNDGDLDETPSEGGAGGLRTQAASVARKALARCRAKLVTRNSVFQAIGAMFYGRLPTVSIDGSPTGVLVRHMMMPDCCSRAPR
jgi:hypothetical protein